jgi:predicted methyltransferase
VVSDEPGAEAIVREVAVAVRLAEGEAGVRDLIHVLGRLGSVPTRTLSRATGLPVPIVAAIAGELRKRGVVARERPTRLTPLGRRLFGDVGPGPALECTCPTCEGIGLCVPEELEPLVAALARLAAEAPAPRTELDQSHCTPETKLRRALALHQVGALEGKRVLLLGDDDLVSLAIHLLAARAGFAETIRELALVDVDKAVLAYVGSELVDTPFRVSRVEHDLRRPLPSALTGSFDTVFTDPPYTAEGAEVFLSRAASALGPAGGGNLFLAFGPKPPRESLRLQGTIARMGFVTRRIVANFNEYFQAGILGGTSHLYHLISTADTRPLVTGTYEGALYTGERRRPRPYRCTSCGTVQRVGRGARWSTVEVLRSDGCPECGAAKFRPLPRDGPRARSESGSARKEAEVSSPSPMARAKHRPVTDGPRAS